MYLEGRPWIAYGCPYNYRATHLDCHDCRLLDLEECALRRLPNLHTVDLSNNRLTALPRGLFAGCTNLRTVDLRDNWLDGIPADLFVGCTNLRTVHLHNNRLDGIPEGLFAGCDNLRVVHLHNNRLRSIPADLLTRHLESVTVDDNQLDVDDLFATVLQLRSWHTVESEPPAQRPAQPPAPSVDYKTVKEAIRCAISLEDTTNVGTLACGHTFGRDGLEKWLDTGKRTCPYCRALIS